MSTLHPPPPKLAKRPPALAKAFFRSQISSLIATGVDFSMTVVLVEVLGFWYVPSVAIGAFLGAVTHFMLGRHWSFEAAHYLAGPQILRYAVVSGASLVLNTLGVWAVTEGLHLHYLFSKVGMALIVGVFFNFPLHRRYVFR